MLIDTCAIAQRAAERAKLDQAIEAFLASGKKIHQVASGMQSSQSPEEKQMERGRESAVKKRSPARKASKKKHSGEDLADFSRRMLEGGFV